jgi:hypothetical protein
MNAKFSILCYMLYSYTNIVTNISYNLVTNIVTNISYNIVTMAMNIRLDSLDYSGFKSAGRKLLRFICTSDLKLRFMHFSSRHIWVRTYNTSYE